MRPRLTVAEDRPGHFTSRQPERKPVPARVTMACGLPSRNPGEPYPTTTMLAFSSEVRFASRYLPLSIDTQDGFRRYSEGWLTMLTQALSVLDLLLCLVVSTGYPRQAPVETSSLTNSPNPRTECPSPRLTTEAPSFCHDDPPECALSNDAPLDDNGSAARLWLPHSATCATVLLAVPTRELCCAAAGRSTRRRRVA